jgi:3-phenylpropionate/trans-cinnamate dioxygenase alpha subunit
LAPTCPDLFEWLERRRAEKVGTIGEAPARLAASHWDASIFPNCSYLIATYVFKVWHPLGPDKIEIMTWAFAEKEMSDDLKQRIKVAAHRVFGPAGTLEADDIDNMEYVTLPNRGYITRQGRLNCQMGLGEEREDPVFPGVLSEFLTEHAQRGFYRAWADCLESNNWQELEAKTANWKQAMLRNKSLSGSQK